MRNKLHQRGFTLLEILIAMFIFTILSVMLMTALRSVINAESGAERSAQRLRQLQMALLILSRDIEQAINRPVYNAAGKEEKAFIGTPQRLALTHMGYANPNASVLRSTLQRTSYVFREGGLWRGAWDALDQTPASRSHQRQLLANLSEVRFQYLDNDNHFQDYWPLVKDSQQPLPRAVRISLTFPEWGSMSQLYVISARTTKQTAPEPPKPE